MKSMKNNNHHKHRRPLQLPLLLLLLLLLPLSESAQRARRGWWARGGLPVVVEGEEPPEGEVEDMIASTLRRQLPGCHKVIVSDRHPVRNVMKALGEEVFVWEMQPLLASLPPPRPLLRTTHRQGGAAPLCVAFVILAPLQVVAAAMEGLQRGEWFQGARKLVFAYTGFANTSLEAAVERHATLRSAYGTVLAAWTHSREAKASAPSRLYQVVTTCPYCKEGGPNAALVDQWTPGTTHVTEKPLYPDTFKNFHGHQFKIVTLEYAPFSCYTKMEDKEDGDEMHGHGQEGRKRRSRLELKDCVDTRMLRAMATSLNFTYVVREPLDGQWGYRLQNGSYTG
ncbi:hypothetical protein O3P69_012536 [Scylla paramamosain]|uniref:Uncharacterized protein n=2 Tax=Scylla paramamosain TaxID=85552 RepID=A0AAW0SHA5_SCYPA